MISDLSASRQTGGYRRSQKVGLLLGPTLLAIVLLLPAPTGLAPQAQHLVALIALMAVWWSTEAVPLAATSLLLLVLLPVLGIMTPEAAAAPYADPNIFLFLGGFFLAQAFQRWVLHRRVALLILSLVGTQPRQLLLGFMLATAAISMWVSNTATAMMMLPIGVAVVSQIGPEAINPHENGYGNGFGTVFMLGIAYAAGIGGMATLIGTPPNLIFAGQVRQLFPELGEIGFLRWMLVGVPLAGVYLLLTWLYLGFIRLRSMPESMPAASREALSMQRAALGTMSRGEWTVMTIFVLTVAAWIFRADTVVGPLTIPGWSTRLGLEVHDGTVAVAAAKGLDIHPYLLMLPATMAASCGFMLPVATPPNAVAFASGYVTAPQMLRVGLVLDVLGAILVTLAVSTLGRAVFALD